ncbi:MAG: integration host factor subunit beta [Candidatus Electrothrix sp. AR4]|nr:integration host factor subunit beta [Candidatus Electrothrix sp. AR4]
MNKSELIETLAEKIELPVRETAGITKTIIDAMSDALVKNDSIEIRGFGSFTVKEYGAYTGRNPKSGEKIDVAPKKLPFFKVGKDLRERVDGEAKKQTKKK